MDTLFSVKYGDTFDRLLLGNVHKSPSHDGSIFFKNGTSVFPERLDESHSKQRHLWQANRPLQRLHRGR